MFGFQLQKARQNRRTELRRELRERLGNGKAIDTEDLLDRLNDPYPSTWGAVLRERCVYKALQQYHVSDERVAKAFHLTVEQLRERRDQGFTADAKYAREIEERILEELPETPEPGRYQDARDGRGGPIEAPSWYAPEGEELMERAADRPSSRMVPAQTPPLHE